MEVLSFHDVHNNYTNYAAHVHALNHLWWHTPEGTRLTRSHPQMLALVMSELAECLEGVRKGLMDDHLPQYKMAPVEAADTAIRLLDWAGSLNLELLESYSILEGDDPSTHIWQMMKDVVALDTLPFAELGGEVHAILTLLEDFVSFHYPHHSFWDVVFDKLVYNQNRADHRYEARAAAGGKAF